MVIHVCLFVYSLKKGLCGGHFLYLCICISIFVYLCSGRRASVKGVDYTKAGGERGSRAL